MAADWSTLVGKIKLGFWKWSKASACEQQHLLFAAGSHTWAWHTTVPWSSWDVPGHGSYLCPKEIQHLLPYRLKRLQQNPVHDKGLWHQLCCRTRQASIGSFWRARWLLLETSHF